MESIGNGIERGHTAHKDSMSKLGTAISGVTQYTMRALRGTKVTCAHIAKQDIFSDIIQLNHDKTLQAAIDDYHIHFIPIGAVAGGEAIALDVAYAFLTHGNEFPNALTSAGTIRIDLVAGDQYKLKIKQLLTDIAAPANELYSSFLFVEATRRNDGQDTYAHEIAIIGSDAHYPSDRYGSKNVTTD